MKLALVLVRVGCACQNNLSEQPVRATCQSDLVRVTCQSDFVRATCQSNLVRAELYSIGKFSYNWAMYANEMDESMSWTHCSSLLCGPGIG